MFVFVVLTYRELTYCLFFLLCPDSFTTIMSAMDTVSAAAEAQIHPALAIPMVSPSHDNKQFHLSDTTFFSDHFLFETQCLRFFYCTMPVIEISLS
jgi:hypothetical protein